MNARPERLDPDVFRLPVERIRDGYYTDAYFNYTKELLELGTRDPRVVMQVFQRKESLLGGIDEAIAVLKLGAGRRLPDGTWESGWDALDVRALREGDAISGWETVMTIEGPYRLFAHLETVYLGCLARRTLIMRNVHEVVEAARGKPILFFPARHDHWLVQTGDGWAAHVAGAIGVSTDAQASWWGGVGVGTVPHGLIAAFGGDTVAAAAAFADRYADAMNVTVLVDFENDSVRTALAVARALGPRLWGVRLDTSDRLADESLRRSMGDAAPTGRRARARPARAVRARRARLPRRPDRGLRRLHRGADPGVRGRGRARRLLRRRVVADPRRQRLHRRRRDRRRAAVREGRAGVPAQRPARARQLTAPPAARISSSARSPSPGSTSTGRTPDESTVTPRPSASASSAVCLTQ